MALPPSVPTSFVPRSASVTAHPSRSGFSGALSFLSYGVFGIAILLAVGVFFYARVLVATKESKDASLTKLEAAIDTTTVETFVRLRDRLNSGATLLDKHVAFSNFFALLGALLPSTVRLSSLHLSLDTSGKTKLDGTGVAKSFNALAAASAAFAEDGRVKEAIFSNIVVDAKNDSVSFDLSATLDQKSFAFSPDAITAIVPDTTSVPSEVLPGTSAATTTP